MSGTLVLVATPIGNLDDLSFRAVQALRDADTILCEDTRRTGKLLQHAGVAAGGRLLSVHDRNEATRLPQVLARLAAGETVAMVTDAGTPAISDPGERVVRAASGAGHTVTVVPGPSAFVAALTVSGLATERFCFEGFLPAKGPERRKRLDAVAAEARTVVLYEAPHRLVRTLGDLAAACGSERAVVLARELTKLHEEVWRGTLGDAVARSAAAEPRGEHVLVLDGRRDEAPAEEAVAAAVAAALAEGLSVRDAAGRVAASLGIPRKRAYDIARRPR